VVDNNENEVVRLGHYGTLDSAGPRSMIRTSARPLGWPEAVGVSRKAIYVADVPNRRILRLKRTYAAEKRIALPD